MPTIFTPAPTHSCMADNSLEPDLNKDSSRRVAGEIWQCPTCAQKWMWDVEPLATVSYPKWVKISDRAASKVIAKAVR